MLSITSAADRGSPAIPALGQPTPRRGFLRGLISLPLIGGSLALIGHPIATAEVVTPDLLSNYNQWLWGEHCRCARELEAKFGFSDARFTHVQNAGAAFHSKPDWNWNPDLAEPSTRAALVMSAVGCNWRERDARYALRRA